MSKTVKTAKYQRVSKSDAQAMLEKLIKNYKDPCQPSTTYVEDYAGANQEFINAAVVDQLITKLTR